MELTGKCKEEHQKWFESRAYIFLSFGYYDFFSIMPSSMQYGIYVDFFDSVGIYPDVQPVLNYDEDGYTEIGHFIVNVFYTGNFNDDYIMLNTFNSRPEARTAAIEKANQIFNKRQSWNNS